LDDKIRSLQKEIEYLKKEVSELRHQLTISNKKNIQPWQSNFVTDWMIKLVHPSIYAQKEQLSVGFARNRRKIAASIYPDQKMFIYVTVPVKRIIGLATVIGKMEVIEENRWPYQVPLKWEIGPKEVGISLKDAGMDVRPRPVDSLYGITEEIAEKVIQILIEQKDISKEQWDLLANQYSESINPSLEEAVIRLREAKENKAALELNTYFAKDGTRRGWEEYVIKGHFSIKYPRAKSIIWPDTYR